MKDNQNYLSTIDEDTEVYTVDSLTGKKLKQNKDYIQLSKTDSKQSSFASVKSFGGFTTLATRKQSHQ